MVAPLFAIRPLAWDAPDPASIDAILITSANTAREAGPQLELFCGIPCHTVGEATAAAVRDAGLEDVRVGPADGIAALTEIDGKHVLHLCGRDHVPLERPGLRIERRTVYSAEAVGTLPAEARQAVERGALVLIHSPRAGTLFARLVDQAGLPRTTVSIAAISEAAAAAAGAGWRSLASAERPRDEALLELACRLCQTGSGRVRE